LNHVAEVCFVLQHLRNTFTGPKAGVGTFAAHVPATVGCGRRNTLFVERCRNLAAAHTIQRHSEDLPHNWSNFLVNDDLVFFRWVHLVAIHWFPANELTFTLLIPFDRLDLLGDVLCVHIIHDGAEGRDVICTGFHAGIDTVQEGDVAHPMLREVPLHVMAGHNVVAAQSGEVFGDDHIDLLGLNVRHHALEGRTVEACSAPAIVDVGVVDLQTVFACELIQ